MGESEMPAMDAPRTSGIQSPEPWLGYLLLMSTLFMLNATLFFTLNTGMDMYGFYTLESVSVRPLPAVLSTLLSCVMAVASYLLYRWLCRRRAWFSGHGYGPFTRSAVLSAVPVFFAFAPGIVLTCIGCKPNLIAVAGLMAGSLCVIHALRDPEMYLDPDLARSLFISVIFVIAVFLALSIGAMLVLYTMGEQPTSGNFLWKWEHEWSDLGYEAEQFQQRQRESLVAYTLTGSGFMIAVLGGSLLGSILGYTRRSRNSTAQPPPADSLSETLLSSAHHSAPTATARPHEDVPTWVDRVIERLESLYPSAPGEEREYVAALSGRETQVTDVQYQRLVADKDSLLREFDLFVDKVVGSVFLRIDGTWTRLDFRVGDRTTGIRSGPFSLLCIYARYPGRRFANAELSMLLERDLSDRVSVDVGEFISQLRRRTPPLPVDRDELGSFLSDATKVCYLDYRQ